MNRLLKLQGRHDELERRQREKAEKPLGEWWENFTRFAEKVVAPYLRMPEEQIKGYLKDIKPRWIVAE